MSCSRCGFFNMPGTASCVSCGNPLGRPGGAVATAIAPPRATPLQKRLRQARMAIMGSAVVVEGRRPGFTVALMGLVPGLPQAFLGSPRLGLAFGAAWAIMGASAAWFLGAAFDPFLIGGAIGAHFASALQPWRAELRRLPAGHRIFVTLAAYAFLAGSVYYPSYRLARAHVTPVDMYGVRHNALLEPGDTVLVWSLAPGTLPERGSLVAFRLRNGGALIVDRLLGLPGDRIEWKDGSWRRNGLVLDSAGEPLARTRMPLAIDLTVPKGTCYVWPSLNLQYESSENIRPAQEIGLLPSDRLAGVPTRIAAPFGRRGPLKTR